MNQIMIDKAIDYKRKVAGAFQAITPEDISGKIAGSFLVVTTKIDGEYNLLHFDGESSFLINSNGKVKSDLPILADITKRLKEQKIGSLVATVELHTNNSDRCRVFDVMKALSDDISQLTISAFDLLELDGKVHNEDDYAKTLSALCDIMNTNVIEYKQMSKEELPEYFSQKVTVENQEGLVVRSAEFPFVYKLKPLHTLDMAVVGYTSEDDKVRELLLAVMDDENNFMQTGIVGNGLNDELKSALYQQLLPLHVDSSYLEVDKRRVAFHMVKPQVVVEITVNELLTENTKGMIKKPLLKYDDANGYELKKMVPFVSLIHPVIKCIREDKQANTHDVRLAQITDVVFLGLEESKTAGELPKSEIIFREVYTKASKGETNVKKFLIYKTNKEDLDSSYPAYVFHSTDFSPTRKEPMSKDIRISNSKEQIERLCKEFMEDNVKKGWNLVTQ